MAMDEWEVLAGVACSELEGAAGMPPDCAKASANAAGIGPRLPVNRCLDWSGGSENELVC
jgi:hypothetical protein